MISQQQLSEISDFVLAQGMGVNLSTELREKFNGIHFTICMDDDVVSANPVLEQQSFNLYLIDSSNHCLSFTQNHDLATGVVVAELEEE
jgi:hypothetical protein